MANTVILATLRSGAGIRDVKNPFQVRNGDVCPGICWDKLHQELGWGHEEGNSSPLLKLPSGSKKLSLKLVPELDVVIRVWAHIG